MARGRQTRQLSPEQIDRLTRFRIAERLSLPQLKLAMAAPFGWETLKNALQGRPVWDLSYLYIVDWLNKHLPGAPLPRDGKAAASGEKPEPENGEESEAARTVRGSR